MPPEIANVTVSTSTAAAAPPAAAPSPSGGGRPNLQDRASALRAELEGEPGGALDEGEGLEVDGGEGDEGAVVAPTATQAAPTPTAAPDVSKSRSDRMARIETMRAKEREQEKVRQQRRTSREQTGEVEKLRTRLAELEPMNEVFKDEATLLAAAENKGMNPQRLIEWMRKRAADPGAIAQQESKSVEARLLKQIQDANAKTEALQKQIETDRKTEAETRRSAERASTFVSMATEKAADHPLTAALTKRHGPNGLIAFANQFIVPLLPENYAIEDLHDHLEQFLDEIQVGGPPVATATPAPRHEATPKKNGAEKPVTTLSNDLVASRDTVTEEVPLHRLPLKDRAAKLKESLDRE